MYYLIRSYKEVGDFCRVQKGRRAVSILPKSGKLQALDSVESQGLLSSSQDSFYGIPRSEPQSVL